MKNRIILYNTLIFLILLFILEITFRILGFGYENAPLENDNYLHHKNPTNYSFKCYTPSGSNKSQREFCWSCNWNYVNTGFLGTERNYCKMIWDEG